MPSNEALEVIASDHTPVKSIPIHSLDLPQLYKKPSFFELCQVLNLLKLPPPSWNAASRKPRAADGDDAQGISQYLTRIIGSDLHWISTGLPEEEGEQLIELIHDLASKRLAERCGRSAMGEMIRTWTIPTSDTSNELNIELCEPPLTGDSVGLKTWGTSFVMAKKLEKLGNQYFSHLLHNNISKSRILELGSGTGLLGMTAALLWDQDVILTDLPDIVPNLQVNLKRNGFDGLIEGTSATVLDWSDAEDSIVFSNNPNDKFEIILVSDPFYDTHHPQLLAQVIPKFLKKMDGQSRLLVSVPLRDDATRAMKNDFEMLMNTYGFDLLSSGTERCFDDWEESPQDDDDGVYCWWSIWNHRCPTFDSFR